MKMRQLMIVIVLLLAISGCTKYTTPRKVEKRLGEGTWRITSFTMGTEVITLNYAFYTFVFDNDGQVEVREGTTVDGTWEVGNDKNPALLYLSFPAVDGLEYLSDDWQVLEMKKNLMKLKRNTNSSTTTLVTFAKQ
ncbi:MAG: hypothetical protein A3D31_16940 [Candidatus Fluviicola riflensis]|nr:MAG: hypothetical protein CHH17_01880 [Candidatus Fluviicola riflensis]OGS76677.1 MAG: hypothetical protein A3D31_16940 [Candidatus Fluviicola riflensis]OGS82968.1 MAG: hypothetical protein A2724_14420 [Fluviicola sp. RIFCSPHIGHO2_01_FULL_43_53]OGS88408.1 MAG: hypothetical protein A3E30_06445 [Fluviicola sp. RIFCSPHIGHO2_12_FULL_43_24]